MIKVINKTNEFVTNSLKTQMMLIPMITMKENQAVLLIELLYWNSKIVVSIFLQI